MNAEEKTPEEKKPAAEKPKRASKKEAAAKPKAAPKNEAAAKSKAAPKKNAESQPAEAKKPAPKKQAAAKKASEGNGVYAIIKTGGKQYRVSQDDMIDVELLHLQPGEKVEFKEVLFINDGQPRVGEPSVAGSVVKGEVVAETAGPKVVSLKYRPRQHSQKKFGHRQHYSRVKITEIAVG